MRRLTHNLWRITLGALCLVASASSADATTLYLRTSSANDQPIELGEISAVAFGDQTVTVSLNNGTNIETSVQDFISIRSNTDGNNSTAVAEISGDSNQNWDIYNITGAFIGNADAAAVKSLNSGIYIFKSESKSFKVIVP